METTPSSESATEYEVLSVFSELATRHVNESDGRLVLLDIDPENLPAQTGYYMKGNPIAPRQITTVATLAEPRFPKLLEVAASEKSATALEEVADVLTSGGNIKVVTNHGELTDIAIAEAALYVTLKRKEIEFASAIIISKMVSMVGFKVVPDQPAVPAATVLSWLCNDVFLTFPNTPSVHNSAIGKNMRGTVSSHNVQAMSAVMNRLDEGNALIAVAPSGSTDKLIPGTDIHGMEAMSRGTRKMLRQAKTKVLPVAIWLKDEKPFFEICGNPRTINNDDEAHAVMVDIASTLDEGVDGRHFMYPRKATAHNRDRT